MVRSFLTAVLVTLCACLPAEVRTLQRNDLQPRLVFLRGGGGNSVVLFAGHRALIIDPKMWPWDTEVSDLVRANGATELVVVNTHAHEDHTLGNLRFPDAIIVAAPSTLHELQANSASDQRPLPAAVPTVPVQKRMRVHLGLEPVELVHPAAAHTEGDVFAWMPERKVLVTGDLFDNGYYPHVDRRRGGTLLGYRRVLDELCRYPAEIVIPGHGDRATIADVVTLRDFLVGIEGEIFARRAKGESDREILKAMRPRADEKFVDLGPFSSREDVVSGLLAEMPRE